jgi:hypothetical protein
MTIALAFLGLSNAGLIWLLRHVLTDAAKERRLLNACIQKPAAAVTAAVADQAPGEVDMRPYIGWDDDTALHESLSD